MESCDKNKQLIDYEGNMEKYKTALTINKAV
jgi:hypothetical protein